MKYGIHGYKDSDVIRNYKEDVDELKVEMLNGDVKSLPLNSKSKIEKEQRKQSFDFSVISDMVILVTVFQILLILIITLSLFCNFSITGLKAAVDYMGILGVIPSLVVEAAAGYSIIKFGGKLLGKIYKPEFEKIEEMAKHHKYLENEETFKKSEINLNNIDNYTLDDLIKVRDSLTQVVETTLTEQSKAETIDDSKQEDLGVDDNLEKPKSLILTNNKKIH